MQEAAHDLNNCKAFTNCRSFELDTNGHTLPWQKRQVFHVCIHWLIQTQTHNTCDNILTFKHMAQTYTQTGTNAYTQCECTVHTNKCLNSLPIRLQMYVCHCCSLAVFSKLICDDIRQWWQRCRGGGGGGENWTGNYVLQLRHAEEILKAILQCLGTGWRKGGMEWKATVQSVSPAFLPSWGGVEERREERQASYV